MSSLIHLRKRILARLYDGLILNGAVYLILYFTILESAILTERGGAWSVVFLSYMILVPLFWNGYVIGRKMNQIQLQYTKSNLSTLDKFRHLFLREFVGFYLIGLLTIGLSFIASMIMIYKREDNKGIHDLIGGTHMVEHEQEAKPFASAQHASN
ncbi:RDD family protein [Salisediminibacterium beveridgei]|uniref:RDD domain-containing protein n=1 Tax=Salisediminibacterium beveridgei TaxID=632773 RepID=A0A1D7QZA4_9BACI|nr:RDD family protein [Salisediminibacterium beveridgei]AOM84349.1 hypothetical protein BBEV_3031 [Salisediminibacterium beveridgei]